MRESPSRIARPRLPCATCKVADAFPTQCPDEALSDGLRPRSSDWGADDPDVGAGEDGVEGRGELAVSVADQEPEPEVSTWAKATARCARTRFLAPLRTGRRGCHGRFLDESEDAVVVGPRLHAVATL